jgi:hypothetical protein
MKQFIVTLILTSQIMMGYGQVTNVPDDNFEQRLIDLGYDDVLDDEVLTVNIEDVVELNLNGEDISDLTGIEDFTSLVTLAVSMNNLELLDISANTELRFLHFVENNISTIDLSSNVLLEVIGCSVNELTEIDLSSLINLRDFYGSNNNFTELDFSTCTELEIANVGANPFTHLDFSNNPNLNSMYCRSS